MNDVSFSNQLARPTAILDGVAADTWQAYNAMQTTKQRHYELLNILENKKKKFNIDPTEKDQVCLANLLSDHDAQVKRFTDASNQLKAVDASAHRALFVYIGQLAALGAPEFNGSDASNASIGTMGGGGEQPH